MVNQLSVILQEQLPAVVVKAGVAMGQHGVHVLAVLITVVQPQLEQQVQLQQQPLLVPQSTVMIIGVATVFLPLTAFQLNVILLVPIPVAVALAGVEIALDIVPAQVVLITEPS